jgi:DNA-binding transcriptional regulator GbsR (MarR family)
MINWEEKYELDRALEELMDKIEKSNVTNEQFEEMGAIYDNANSWDDYYKLEEMFDRYRG